MSKFFNETRKAQQWAQGEGVAKGPDVERLLDTVKQAEAATTQMAETRLGTPRKIRLPHPSGVPLISPNGSAPDQHIQIAIESYRALRTRLMRQQASTGIRSVVIASALAREGKTLTTMNLAHCCAQLQGARVLVVDADLRTRGLSKLLGYPSGPGLAEVLAGQAEFEEAVVATDQPNLYAVSAGTAMTPTPELFAGDRWKEFMGWCAESFKLVLVDSPPILPLADYDLISSACDGILVVVLALRTQRDLLRKVATQVDHKKLLGVVFNAADAVGSNYYYYRYYGGNTGQN